MTIEASQGGADLGRRIRLGMVGGGEGAFIGAVHRIAARLDDQYELVAGALSAQPEAVTRTAAANAAPAARRRFLDASTRARPVLSRGGRGLRSEPC